MVLYLTLVFFSYKQNKSICFSYFVFRGSCLTYDISYMVLYIILFFPFLYNLVYDLAYV